MSRMTLRAPGTVLSKVLRWGLAPAAVAMALAGCGGGGGGGSADASSTGAASAQMNGVAAFALAQQSVSATSAPAATTPAAGNLVVNSGFENGTAGWGDWGNSTVVSGQAHSGSLAQRVGPGAGGVGQVVPGIVPGTTYRLTAQAKVSAASETAYVGLNFIDAAGNPLTQNSVLVNSISYTTASVDVAAPPNAVGAVVYVWKNAGSDVAVVDDFSLQATGQAAPGPEISGNQVVNGGMQDGLQGWANWGNTIATADGSTGSVAKVGPGAGGFGQEVGGIVGGDSYRLSAQAKVSVPGEGGYLGVVFIDAAGNWLLAQNAVFDSSTYQRTEANVTAPTSATRALVFVWKNAGTGFAYVDNVALVQLGATPPAPGPGPSAPPVVQLSGSVKEPLDNKPGYHSPLSLSMARLTNGTYASAWIYLPDPSGNAPYQLCFAVSQLTTSGGQVGPNSCLEGARPYPDLPTYVLPRPDNGFVVVWTDAPESFPIRSQDIRSQAFDGSGRPVGSIQADPQQPAARAAALAGGGYVSLSVPSLCQSTPASTITFQRYSSDGTPIGSPTPVGDSGGCVEARVVALTGGGFAVAWYQGGAARPSAPPVMTRMFSADGTPVGDPVIPSGVPPTCITQVTAGGFSRVDCGYQNLEALGPMDDGGYVIAWGNGFAGAGTQCGLVRRFRPDGTPGAAIGQVDCDVTALAPSGPDGFVAGLAELGRGANIFARVFDASPLR